MILPVPGKWFSESERVAIKHLTYKFILSLAMVMATWTCAPAAEKTMVMDGPLVIDRAGRRIEMKRPFKRIISLYGAHTENLFALGLDREIIGVTCHDDWPPAARDRKVFSYHDGPERFLAARPDLVLIRPMIDRGYGQLMYRLSQSGIAVVSLQPTTIQEMYTYWQILGLLTGRLQKARLMVAHFKMITQKIETISASVKVKKRVYFEAIHDRAKTFAPHAMAIFALETAGGINMAADAMQVRSTNIAAYGKEKILAHASEIDVFLSQVGAMNRPTREMIRNEPGFRAIRAVQNDRIYFIEEAIVSRPTPRLLQGICQIGGILYPGRFGAKDTGPCAWDCDSQP